MMSLGGSSFLTDCLKISFDIKVQTDDVRRLNNKQRSHGLDDIHLTSSMTVLFQDSEDRMK